MKFPARLRPGRTLAFPFALVSFPLLWFVNRDAEVDGSVAAILPRAIGLVAAVVVVSYVVAAFAVALFEPEGWPVPGWARPLVHPSNGTLGVFVALSLALWTFVALSSPGSIPADASLVVEVLFLWPLVVLYAGTIVLGNVLTGEPSLAVQFVVVGVGVALSAAWLFLLSGWIARLAIPGDSGTAR